MNDITDFTESTYNALADEHERSLCPQQSSVIAPFPTQVLCTDADLPRAKRALDGLAKFPVFLRILERRPPKHVLLTSDFDALAPTLALAITDVFGAEKAQRLALDKTKWKSLAEGFGGGFNIRRNSIVINLDFMKTIDTLDVPLPAVPAFSNTALPVTSLAGREEMPTALLVHELSHVIDFKVIQDESAPVSEALLGLLIESAKGAHAAGRTVSKYANSDSTEWFAETMTAYLYWPDALRDYDAMSHLAMKTTLEELR